MEIDDSSSLIFYTYYMVRWDEVSQSPSKVECLSCGGKMMDVEPVRDKKGLVYEGLVCHNCKTVIWSRKG
jgi:hypothetical protein